MALSEINAYRFGAVVVGEECDTTDNIICPDRVVKSW
jgi:hypothetical protein